MKFLLEIYTPERKAFSEEIDYLSVPTSSGIIGVMARHVQLFTSLIEGEVKIVSNNQEFFLAIGGGFMQVLKDRVIVLVSRAVHATELNEEEIQQAEKSAKELVANAPKGAERAEAQAMLRRTILDLKVLRHRKSKNSLVN